MKTVWKNSTSTFFSPSPNPKSKVDSKVDDIKIKSKVSAFFLRLPVYLQIITLLSLLFACLQGLKRTKSSLKSWFGVQFFKPIFINPDIYMYI